jgi:hypothetical protein
MTKMSKEIEKKISNERGSKPVKRDRSWRLLIVGDHGTIFSFKRIKGLAFTVLFFTGLAILTAIAFGLFYFKNQQEMAVIEKQLLDLHKENSALRQEKDILQASLVIARSKLGENIKGDPSSSISDDSAMEAKEEPLPSSERMTTQSATPEAVTPAKEPEPVSQQQKLESVSSAQREKEIKTASEPSKAAVVVENLKVEYDSNQDVLSAQFKIKNNIPENGRVAGRCILVLENGIENQERWLSLPRVNLIAGKPSGKRGRSFRIARFMNIRLKSMGLPEAFRIEHGVLYVYSTDGELLLEEDVFLSLVREKTDSTMTLPPLEPNSELEEMKQGKTEISENELAEKQELIQTSADAGTEPSTEIQGGNSSMITDSQGPFALPMGTLDLPNLTTLEPEEEPTAGQQPLQPKDAKAPQSADTTVSSETEATQTGPTSISATVSENGTSEADQTRDQTPPVEDDGFTENR